MSYIPFPDKKYNIIYADPPWSYNDKNPQGSALKHYPTMGIDDICALPVKDLADENAALFVWATYPTLPYVFKVIDAWGFKYKTLAFQWVKNYKNGKPFFGIGHWTRSNTEPCFLAVKGDIKRLNNSVSQLIFSEIRRHSEKPPETRELITKLMGDLPRIELFARQSAQGWDSWGNQV